jgi:peptidoglycan hydrolase CwlO-like protein
MDAMEAVAIIILIMAIVVLVYYYLLNSPTTVNKLRSYVPTTADAHMNEILGGGSKNDDSGYDLTKEEDSEEEKTESNSMGKRIKVKLSDIDFNTDSFSNKIDAFLDEKSDELIKDWSLATTNDLEELESKFSETTANVDSLDKSFNEFKKSSEEFQKATEEKLNDLDKRIESLENN